MRQQRVHTPVMLNEVMSGLAIAPGGHYIDATFGAGGYTRAFLERGARVTAFDRDPSTAVYAAPLTEEYGSAFVWHNRPYSELRLTTPANSVDGIAFDLGVSSMQLDEAERGFSFRFDAPLDMRMNPSVGASAAQLVNTLSETQLADSIFQYGEERCARRIAREICSVRKTAPIETTNALASLVRRVVPKSRDGLDPATRTFQALRIVVNDELGELQAGIDAAAVVLKPAGRLVVVSFHSLEDSQVKRQVGERASTTQKVSRLLPHEMNDNRPPLWRWISKKPLTPSKAEASSNPRARSARLRVAERLSPPLTVH
ncbi:MAG: 16S rRNA (cytosine(1402)-N(4))-methyltransferase RsmH [Holosporales bacterium]|jgi:16S rRNA (cytosine1402-N4)-methyltransferase|nr:16S rRNA (cytosine(1402)-N(4))-methyltransferase RsmH [Thalassospira sp.]